MLRYDPFDLAHLELFLEGQSLGAAAVIQQGREKHIAVERLVTQPPELPKPKTSLDYLAALRTEYQEMQRQEAGQLQYAKLSPQPVQPPSEASQSHPQEK